MAGHAELGQPEDSDWTPWYGSGSWSRNGEGGARDEAAGESRGKGPQRGLVSKLPTFCRLMLPTRPTMLQPTTSASQLTICIPDTTESTTAHPYSPPRALAHAVCAGATSSSSPALWGMENDLGPLPESVLRERMLQGEYKEHKSFPLFLGGHASAQGGGGAANSGSATTATSTATTTASSSDATTSWGAGGEEGR